MKEFGLGGLGLFPVPQVVLAEVKRQYRVEAVGSLDAVRSRFFAITNVRRLKHPAVIAISEAARRELFD
jgi:LysR family transcriptional activator of nhaA